MEILRHSTNQATVLSFNNLVPTSEYTLIYSDLNRDFTETLTSTSDVSGNVSFILDSYYMTYDAELDASLYDYMDEIVLTTGVDIVRPYCNVYTLATDLNKSIDQATSAEQLARYIIDSEVDYSFGFVRKEKEYVGNGSDYLILDEKIQKLYKIYENRELIFEEGSSTNVKNFEISKDKNFIVSAESPANLVNYPKVWRDRYLSSDFADGYEYLVDADFGYKVVPNDIQEACRILAADLLSDNMKYVNKYIESFDNQEFKIKFAKGSVFGTGNLVVDRILKKYKNSIRVGVL